MTKRIFCDSERQTVDDLLNKHGLAPKDIAEKWDTSTCVVYKQLSKWGIKWQDHRINNYGHPRRNSVPSKAIKIIEVAERTSWPAERVALHCGTSISYTKQVLTKGLPGSYTKRGQNIKEAKNKIAISQKMIKEGSSRAQAARAVGWSVYQYKYWLAEIKKPS